MKERIVNIYAYVDGESIRTIGYSTYEMEGTYQQLTSFLQSRVEIDHATAICVDLDETCSILDFRFAMRVDGLPYLIPLLGEIVGDSVYCVTQIIDGEPRADEVSHDHEHNPVPDYLRIYWTSSGLDFGQLIDDDFMDAIKVLWNHEKYISALKLLFTMIDTLGFAAFGPLNDCFKRWLDEYCDLSSLGVSSAELWELRNSLLHMSNLTSRQVGKGSVTRLLPVITASQGEIPIEMGGFKNLHLSRFIWSVVPLGVVNWVGSIVRDRKRFATFLERYDTVVSEARLSVASRTDEEMGLG